MKMLTALCLLALTACGSVDAQSLEDRAAPPEIRTSEVKGSDTVSVQPVLEYGADVNRGPCATNYNRVAPGLCVRNPPLQLTIAGTSCETFNLASEIPANAKTIGVSIFASMDNDGTPNTFLDGTISIYNGDNTACSAGSAQHFQYQFYDSAGITGTVFGTTIKSENIFLNGSRNLNYEKIGTIGGETPFLTQYTD